ncbi:UNVERIFIED_CONTAM: hypothetical protein GTU68_012795 [Idotea baltica]|nr:hypothetical protein [Idotea baltica]
MDSSAPARASTAQTSSPISLRCSPRTPTARPAACEMPSKDARGLMWRSLWPTPSGGHGEGA